MSETATTTSVHLADGDMPAHLWLPPSGSGPGLLLLQEIFGVSTYIRSRARDLADLGYVVLAPELYWRLGETVDEARGAVLDPGLAPAGRLDSGPPVGRPGAP